MNNKLNKLCEKIWNDYWMLIEDDSNEKRINIFKLLKETPVITASNPEKTVIPIEEGGGKYLHDRDHHLKDWFVDADGFDWSGMAIEPTETKWLHNWDQYLDNTLIYK